MKDEIDIIPNIALSPIGRAVILMVMYVENFKKDVIVFIGIKRHDVTSH